VHALRFYERESLMLSEQVARGTGGHRRYSPQDVRWLRICTKLRKSGMPLAKIRRFAELEECRQIISRKVGVYEQHLAEGTAQDVWTAKP